MPSLESSNGPSSTRYWRSLAELQDLPEFRQFLEAEFLHSADPGGINRRRWLQVMGASLALAGVAGCRTERKEILPFAQRPEGRTPGAPQQYATAMDLAGSAVRLLVTCVDGRPIKVDGNPQDPRSQGGGGGLEGLGGSDVLAQAAVLELYDPDRSRTPVQRVAQSDIAYTSVSGKDPWGEFDRMAQPHFAAVREKGGAGFCVLARADGSPTLARLRKRLLADMPEAQWFEYEPLTDDHERNGARQAFGRPYRTHLALDQADVILCLDADLLGSHPARLRYARDFAARRDPDAGSMNRLYVVESAFSITGAAADHRLPMRSSQIAALVGQLQQELERRAGGQREARTEHSLQAGGWDVQHFVRVLAQDLMDHRGRSAIAAGPGQPPEVHAAVHRLNHLLGNTGKTVRYTRVPDAERAGHVEAISRLAEQMRAGRVQTLLVLGGNPVYNAPADVEFAKAMEDVPMTIHAGVYRNETAGSCQWHVPLAHFLESWGDATSFDGTYSVVQPMIAPLYGGRSSIQLLAQILGDPIPEDDRPVRETFQELVGDRYSDSLWRKTVHDGLLADSAWPAETAPEPKPVMLRTDVDATASPGGDLELVFTGDASVYDGRYANNSWLQECPDPLTKLTWDNAAILSPATAQSLGVDNQSLVTLRLGDRSIEIPAYVMPGQADGSIAAALGYGRTAAGLVGGLAGEAAPVGVDAYRVRTSQAMYVARGVSVEPTRRRSRLATTQDHHAIDKAGFEFRKKRVGELVRETSLDQYQKHPDSAAPAVEHSPLESMWDEHEYTGHRWGMAIDLSKCIGCNACVVACQAENNVPVVGKEQVLRGREMHWIRVDRYFRGDARQPERVQVALQPVACHQCELAPCEQVCPVAATVHSREGLNDMVYNRCIGTRYCANNCPYKVRRFNYFNYHKELDQPDRQTLQMAYNPDVTVRSRGVMEKCTYCIQRIQAAKIQAKNEGRAISDGQIQTACQQACPAGAITFGDLADTSSQVAQRQRSDRAYAMLAELNIKPRTVYLAKIRNPHPELESSDDEDEQHHG